MGIKYPQAGVKAIVIGVSAGGLSALTYILEALPENFPIPVLIVQHRVKDEKNLLEEILQTKCRIKVRQAEEKIPVMPQTVYIAPADYHLLVEHDQTLSLSYDPYVNFSRPSIDVLFETAAEVFAGQLVGIILTGASKDGANGILAIRKSKGTTIAQDPAEAQFPYMPQAAIDLGGVQHIMKLTAITEYILKLGKIDLL